MDFKKEVRKALIDRDMSMSDLANGLNISVSYVSELLSGTRSNEEKIKEILAYLSLEDLFEKKEDSHSHDYV